MTTGNEESQFERERRNLDGALLHWVLGALILPAIAITYYFIFRGISPESVPRDFFWEIVKFAFLLSVPGVLYIALGFFHLFGYKYVEKLSWKVFGITGIQLIPGLLVSILTPTLPGMPNVGGRTRPIRCEDNAFHRESGE